MDNGYFTVPRSFLEDSQNFSQPTTSVFLVLRSLVYEYSNGECWVRCSYEYITKKSNIKSTVSIRKAILELAAYGWIKDFKRGGKRKDENGNITNITNQYLLPEKRILNPSIALFEKIAGYKKDENS